MILEDLVTQCKFKNEVRCIKTRDEEESWSTLDIILKHEQDCKACDTCKYLCRECEPSSVKNG